MNNFLKVIGKHSRIVLLVIASLTVFFLYHALDIRINASFSAFMPWGESTDYYDGGISGQVAKLGTEKAERESIALINRENGERVILNDSDTSIPVAQVPYADVVDVRDLPPIKPQEGADYPRSTNYLILVQSEDLFTAKKLNLVEYVMSDLENMNEFFNKQSVLDFITVEKRGTRLGVRPMDPREGEYWTEEEAKLLETRIANDPVVKYYLVGGSGDSLLYQFSISNVSSAKLKEIDSKLDLLRENGIEVYLNGGAVINDKVMEYLNRDLITLVSLSLVVILVVFFISFKSIKSVFITASLSIIALIWTFGTMALVDIPLSILNVVTPCMVLTLGSAYSVHVVSEYYSKRKENPDITAIEGTKGIYKTIAYACITTVLGFLCLCISQTEGLREFGISVSFGIAYCAILACFYLPAVFSLIGPPKEKQVRKYDSGVLVRFVSLISKLVVRYWVLLLVVLCLLICAYFYVDDKISVNSNYMSYFPESDLFGRESKHFAAELGGATPYTITITAPEGSTRFFTQSENLAKVRAYEEKLMENPDFLQVISFSSYVAYANSIMSGVHGIPESAGLANMLHHLILMMSSSVSQLSTIISDDANTIGIVLQHWDAEEQDLMTAGSITRTYVDIVSNLGMLPEGTSVSVSGSPLPNIKFSNRLLSDQNRSTLLSLAVVFLFAWITARSLRQGFLTIVPVLCGIMINYVFMFLAGIPFDIITVSFSSIAIGCGVDDAIHFMIRVNEKRKGHPAVKIDDLIAMTIKDTGRPIILTTTSIICGMMMLSFASYTPIRYFGLLMSVTLFGCMASTLIFLPSVAILVDRIKTRFVTKIGRKA